MSAWCGEHEMTHAQDERCPRCELATTRIELYKARLELYYQDIGEPKPTPPEGYEPHD